MSKLPFEIPQSLASYVDHFQKEPDQAINRLKKQLKKRGTDAVGHFLLAWLYHLRDLNDLAVEEAHKARIFAPGSPFFRKLHYYFSHPNTFEAWTPNDERTLNTTSPSVDTTTPLSDLDSLIERLTAVESNPIRINDYQEADLNGPGEQDEAVSEENIDSIASETLAAIHEQQGKTEAAIKTYQQLKQLRKEKTAHYNKQISRLEKIHREEKEKQ